MSRGKRGERRIVLVTLKDKLQKGAIAIAEPARVKLMEQCPPSTDYGPITLWPMPRRKAEVVQYPIYLGLGVERVAERGEQLPALGARQRYPAGAAGTGPAGPGDGGFVLLAVPRRLR